MRSSSNDRELTHGSGKGNGDMWQAKTRRRHIITIIAVALASTASNAQVVFQDVGGSRGIDPYAMALGSVGGVTPMGAGIAAADYDSDGFVDVFAPNKSNVADQLYHNLGNGSFEEIGSLVGLGSMDANRTALWFDYDGDSDLDLIVANDVTGAPTSYRLYRQDTPTAFQDVTAAAGLFISPAGLGHHHRGGLCAGDINNDGYLDLATAAWGGPIHLFLNNQDGTFADVSVASGVGVFSQYAHQIMMADLNGDGWLDIYVAVDFAGNQLWVNQKDGTFIETAGPAGADNDMNDMGLTLGDYDNDGDLDIYVTNIIGILDTNWEGHTILLRNESVGSLLSFNEVSETLGVDDAGWGWGTTFMDGDNDGWLDIAATNGFLEAEYQTDASRFFRNSGGAPISFSDVSDSVQFNDTFWGSCLISFDFDRDGDLDLMQTCRYLGSDPSQLRLLECQPMPPAAGNSHLVVKPRINGPNHRGIGAIVRVTTGSTTMMRLITAGTSYLGQEPAEAFFGTGSAVVASSIIVDWPDGSQTQLNDVPTNQVLTVTHGGLGDLDADNDVDLRDYGLLQLCVTGSGAGDIIYGLGCRSSDMDADGDIDDQDLAILASNSTGSG